MTSLIANEDGTMPAPENFDKSPEQAHEDYRYDILAGQMRALFPDVLAVVADMEQFLESGAKTGDIVYCPARLGEPALSWILVHPSGKCQLLSAEETEDIDWFLNFGPVEILKHPNNH